MKSNYCNDCLTQTDCEYIKVDTICTAAAAFEAGRRDREKELPKNAIIIDGDIYLYDYDVTEDPCGHCDLHKKCEELYKTPICTIFYHDTSADGCFKKNEARL